MPEIIELTKSSAASLDCLSYMIELRRKNILKAESFLMQHRDSLSPERIAQIEQDLEDMRSGVGYVNKPRYIKMDELVPMSRIMTAPNVTNVCYDTAYMANISEVQLFYPTSILYVDGI